jgi:hypothetical protein
LRGHDVQALGPILANSVHAPESTRALKAPRLEDALNAR